VNYYNEHDPKAAAWLRELIKAGLISDGVVDERDIQNVKAKELESYNQCHFFAGIGGWSYALRLAGISDDYPVWTGSCPCQPFSAAGRGMGAADERHLWPDFRNLIGECRPAIVFGEQVASKNGRKWLAGVSADLEMASYRFAAADLCAACVGSPHIRQRLFWMGESYGTGRLTRESSAATARYGCAIEPTGDVGGLSDDESERFNGRQRAAESNGGRLVETGLPESPRLSDNERQRLQRSERNRQTGTERETIGYTGELCVTSERLGDAMRDGSATGLSKSAQREEGFSRIAHHADGPCGFWDSYDIMPFKDGKSRRVEPGTFPLVDGFPARVAILKGFGNAIVPQVAAAFIKAAMI
jgi:DNA (cytosine-5)-methyltransferase 1